jgi:hypothetical protein
LIREQLTSLDLAGVRLVRALPHPRPLDAALVGLSRATDHSTGWLVSALLGAGLDRSRRSRWLEAFLRIAAVEGSMRAIKRAAPRQRPVLKGLPPLAPTTSPMSFPSSHTAAAFAAVGAFDGLLPRPALRFTAVVTAFSRLYLGVHYPSDVLAGLVLGICSRGRP